MVAKLHSKIRSNGRTIAETKNQPTKLSPSAMGQLDDPSPSPDLTNKRATFLYQSQDHSKHVETALFQKLAGLKGHNYVQ